MMPCVALSACAVGPNYKSPSMQVRDTWVVPADTAQVDGQWWRKVSDPILTELVDTAIANNKDLDEAAARLREARANRDAVVGRQYPQVARSEEHTSELQSLMRISYAVFCLKKKK